MLDELDQPFRYLIPDHILKLADSVNGEPISWQEYESKTVIVMRDGRKLDFENEAAATAQAAALAAQQKEKASDAASEAADEAKAAELDSKAKAKAATAAQAEAEIAAKEAEAAHKKAQAKDARRFEINMDDGVDEHEASQAGRALRGAPKKNK